MDIKEKADNYAMEKTHEVIIRAIAEAYKDGYDAGYKDGKGEISLKSFDDTPTDYIDLGLPSHTLWAADYERTQEGEIVYLPYCKAKEMQLPTEEQVNELFTCCQWVKREDKGLKEMKCIGPNGNSLSFEVTGYYKAGIWNDKTHIYFEIESEISDNKNKVGNLYCYYDIRRIIKSQFTGCHFPVRCVR